MRSYLIQITMADGLISVLRGLYEDGFDAVISAMDTFPEAKRISAWISP